MMSTISMLRHYYSAATNCLRLPVALLSRRAHPPIFYYFSAADRRLHPSTGRFTRLLIVTVKCVARRSGASRSRVDETVRWVIEVPDLFPTILTCQRREQ